MTDVQKYTEPVTAVSFSSSKDDKMTFGQLEIIRLIKDKIKQKEPIHRKDIKMVYVSAMQKFHTHNMGWYNWRTHTHEQGSYSKYLNFLESAYPEKINSLSLQWFTSNLGRCIIKGKILAIPLIED